MAARKKDFVSEIVAERTEKNPAFPDLVKKASGRNIAESERNTERVTVRLDPEAMALLRHYAAAWQCPMSDVVESALDALSSHETIKGVMKALGKRRAS